MTLQNGESIWKLALGFFVLLFFMGIGVAHIVDPDRYVNKSGVRKGGEMLTKVNRDGFRLVGIVVVVFSGYVIYQLLRDIFTR